jgi:hypothetical protein
MWKIHTVTQPAAMIVEIKVIIRGTLRSRNPSPGERARGEVRRNILSSICSSSRSAIDKHLEMWGVDKRLTW